MTEMLQNSGLTPLQKMSRDVKEAARTLTDTEARFLVDTYYQMQDDRIRSNNRILSMDKAGEPNEAIQWFSNQSEMMEGQIKLCLKRYVESHIMGEWLINIKGIGPVIAAGLLAHIDIAKAETAGAIWRYAGFDPTSEWKKGEIRPWNASLKVVCWKAGCSFVKVSGKEDAYYGQLYKGRKEYEVARNESGQNKESAEYKLSTTKIGKTTDAYKCYIEGKLPPAHVDARTRRWVVKIFLSHLHQVWYQKYHGKPAPRPFAEVHLGHVHIMEAPGINEGIKTPRITNKIKKIKSKE
jgi:hypothetical protein